MNFAVNKSGFKNNVCADEALFFDWERYGKIFCFLCGISEAFSVGVKNNQLMLFVEFFNVYCDACVFCEFNCITDNGVSVCDINKRCAFAEADCCAAFDDCVENILGRV